MKLFGLMINFCICVMVELSPLRSRKGVFGLYKAVCVFLERGGRGYIDYFPY